MKWSRVEEILKRHDWAVAVIWDLAINSANASEDEDERELLKDYVEHTVSYFALRPWGDRLLNLSSAEMEGQLTIGGEQALEYNYTLDIHLVYRSPEEDPNFNSFYHRGSVRELIRQFINKHPGKEVLGIIVTKSFTAMGRHEGHDIYPIPPGDPDLAEIVAKSRA